MMNHLTTFVKNRRKEVNLTQKDFAERAGVASLETKYKQIQLISNQNKIH